ncbi:MAG: hypothetical protein DI571_13380, partial [Arsenicicoccus sp.]
MARIPGAPERPLALFVLGKAPSSSSIFPEVFDLLGRHGVDVEVCLPHDGDEPPDASRVALVVHRGLRDEALPVVDTLVRAGAHCLNPLPGVRLLRRHQRLEQRLAAAGLPVPPSTPVVDWSGVLAQAAGAMRVVKRRHRGRGRGAEVLAGRADDLPAAPPFPGPYVTQPFVPNDGLDRKLYVIGSTVVGLLKPSPLLGAHATTGAPFEVSAELHRLALTAARACRLDLAGVDVVLGPDGPVLVDVNAFPGYRGVPGAAAAIAGLVAARAHREQSRVDPSCPSMDDNQPQHDLRDAAIGDPTAYLPEKSEWVEKQLRDIDAAGTTDAATIQDRPVMVVTMRGARSGMLRRVPLMRVEHDGAYLAVASKGGAPEHPAWYHNIVKNRDVLVQDGTSQQALRARELADGPERDAWWQRAVAAFPSYADYQEKTDRLIPVFV